jgi:hypothetical protein
LLIGYTGWLPSSTSRRSPTEELADTADNKRRFVDWFSESARAQRKLAMTCLTALMAAQTPLVVLAEDLHLGSTNQTVQANVPQESSHAPVITDIGGGQIHVSDGMMLTPAQNIALGQVLRTGNQYLQINAQGAAVGGGFVVNNIPSAITSLTIPEGVRGYTNVANGANGFNFGSQLTNAGSLYVFSNNQAVTSGTLSATNILNSTTGLITSNLPSTASWLGQTVSNLSFTLSAVNNIINQGTISSAGNLSLVAGNTITNSLTNITASVTPTIQALNNLTFNAPNIVNTGLIMQVMQPVKNIASFFDVVTCNSIFEKRSFSECVKMNH